VEVLRSNYVRRHARSVDNTMATIHPPPHAWPLQFTPFIRGQQPSGRRPSSTAPRRAASVSQSWDMSDRHGCEAHRHHRFSIDGEVCGRTAIPREPGLRVVPTRRSCSRVKNVFVGAGGHSPAGSCASTLSCAGGR